MTAPTFHKCGFCITRGKGFQVTYENGITVSVQWGPGNYGDNRADSRTPMEEPFYSSELAEVAIWEEAGHYITGEVWQRIYKRKLGDIVVGWLSAEKVTRILNYCARANAANFNTGSESPGS